MPSCPPSQSIKVVGAPRSPSLLEKKIYHCVSIKYDWAARTKLWQKADPSFWVRRAITTHETVQPGRRYESHSNLPFPASPIEQTWGSISTRRVVQCCSNATSTSSRAKKPRGKKRSMLPNRALSTCFLRSDAWVCSRN